MKKHASKMTAVTGTALAASLALASLAHANPFGMEKLDSGYQVAQADKKTDGKCGEGKCGGAKKASDKKKDGKCGEGKCGGKAKEGSCGAAGDKKKDGKCGAAPKA